MRAVFALDNYGKYEEPVISKIKLKDDLEFCCRLMGQDKTTATETIDNLMKKMQASTQYPAPDLSKIDQQQILSVIDDLTKKITAKKEGDS